MSLECRVSSGFTVNVYLKIRAEKVAKNPEGSMLNTRPIRQCQCTVTGADNYHIMSNTWDNIMMAYEDVYPPLDDEKSEE